MSKSCAPLFILSLEDLSKDGVLKSLTTAVF